MYKILIKYTSTLNKTFWYEHEVPLEDGTSVTFETDDIDVLKEEIHKLDKIYGNENLKIVVDVTYTVTIGVSDNLIDIASPEDILDIYNTAFNNVFGEDD